MAITHLGVSIRWRDDRNLYRYDGEPAAVATAMENRNERIEIDRAVAAHRECAVDHRFEKAPIAVTRELDDRGSDILAVDVADARDVLLEHRDRITPRKRHVAAVEKQADFVAGERHQPVDIGGRFNRGAHVMVIDDAYAMLERVTRESRELVGVSTPLVVARKSRPFVQRRARTLHAVRDFAIDHHRGAIRSEKLEVRSNGGDFFFDRSKRELPRIPARDERQIVTRQHIA